MAGKDRPVRVGGKQKHRRVSLARDQKRIVVFAILLLALMLSNLARAVIAVHDAVLLPDLPMLVSWAYLAGKGLIWGLAFGACTWGLARFQAWGRVSSLLAVHLYELHGWVDRIFLQRASYVRQVMLRDLVLTAIVLLMTWGLFLWTGKKKVLE